MRKPDVICIGAQKAGTSWLHSMLASRHDFWAPPLKELHFFDHKFLPSNRRWTASHIKRGIEHAKANHLRKKNPDPEYLDYLAKIAKKPMFNGNWYKYIFSRAPEDKICFETTPEYCTVPPEGVEFIKRFLPKTKFIYIIRSPVERAISQIKMNARRRGEQPRGLEDWVELAANPEIKIRGDYKSYVDRWDRAFGEERVLYLPFNLIASDPKEIMLAVEDFLRIPKIEYGCIRKVVHKGADMNVPKEIWSNFENQFSDQILFLEERFGKEFVLRA